MNFSPGIAGTATIPKKFPKKPTKIGINPEFSSFFGEGIPKNPQEEEEEEEEAPDRTCRRKRSPMENPGAGIWEFSALGFGNLIPEWVQLQPQGS